MLWAQMLSRILVQKTHIGHQKACVQQGHHIVRILLWLFLLMVLVSICRLWSIMLSSSIAFLIPLFPVDETCLVCRNACLDSFGEHQVHCKEFPGFKYRHVLVSDVLFNIFRCVWVSSKKDALVNFLTDPLEGRSNTYTNWCFSFWVPEGSTHVWI